MKTQILCLAVLACVSTLTLGESTENPVRAPSYSQDGSMALPENYREWIYLSTGFDMSYSAVSMAGHHMFDNVFVEPSAYRAFLATGTWPDKTVFVLEVRGAKDKGSINKHGNYQDAEVMGREVHVKDTARFPENGWAFFGFDTGTSAKMIPRTAQCYSCHAQHAAVDNTFVQFYPTLLPIATVKGTLSAGYKAAEEKN